ncbi:MAG: fumarate hydratase [Candidatus Aenigmarchaeota archaeon]|nr:fumarate hydratase [Candidatus Aenigmarchaeota archaeon]
MITEKDVLDLYRKCATELSSDIKEGLKDAARTEESENARDVLESIIENIEIAKTESKPICQDTGIPVFYVKHDKTQSEEDIRKIIERATDTATKEIPLRPNAVDSVSGKVIGNKPVIHFEESAKFEMTLLMKGGGSENISKIYSLPDTMLGADRDIEGIKKCVFDAVFNAQGKGCPPYIIGIAIGGSIEEVAHLSKKQLLRDINDHNKDSELRKVESELLEGINKMEIGPSGIGGKTTALAIKLAKSHRHPASFFVGVSFGCWATRRASYGH